MGTLDTQAFIESLDSENMLQSIRDLPDQVAAAWREFEQFVLPTHYIQAANVILAGVGASYHAGLIAQHLAREQSRIPITVVSGSTIPNSVSNATFVVAVSYSGETQETKELFEAAARRGAKLFAISTGGSLAALCRKYRAPHFQIRYGAQPRAAFGYLLTPVLGALHRLGHIEFDQAHEIEELAHGLRAAVRLYGPETPTAQNTAKQLATHIHGGISLVVSGELLSGVAQRWVSQMQENAKSYATSAIFPDVNHQLISGLDFPAHLRDELRVISLRSQHDSAPIARHQNVFAQEMQREKLRFQEVVAQPGSGVYADVYSLILLGDYVSFYVALLNGVDPTQTPRTMRMRQALAETVEA